MFTIRVQRDTDPGRLVDAAETERPTFAEAVVMASAIARLFKDDPLKLRVEVWDRFGRALWPTDDRLAFD